MIPKPKFHGHLDEDGPEVWGIPYFSPHGCGWMIAWVDADCGVQGCTVPDYEERAWIEANKEAAHDMRREFAAYCDRMGIKSLTFVSSGKDILAER